MATSVHLPKPLLEAVDKRARRLKVSRNAFIVRALQRELAHETEWSAGFFDVLTKLDEGDAAAMDEVLSTIVRARTRKAPPRL